MKKIGGFFELETGSRSSFMHQNALGFNLARNALAFYLKEMSCTKVYLPYFCCSSLSDALSQHSINYEFYHINEEMEPTAEFKLSSNEFFVYVNYFGLKGEAVKTLSDLYRTQFITDNSQAFFAKPSSLGASIYSARKFFGVPDGAFLYCPRDLQNHFLLPDSKYRIEHLTGRIEQGPSHSYVLYKNSEAFLKKSPISKISNLSMKLLNSVDYEEVSRIRVSNFNRLAYHLNQLNSIFKLSDISMLSDKSELVPMIYPLYITDGGALRARLIDNGIFVAKYWQDVADCDVSSELEKDLAENIVCLPVDHRYSGLDMDYIAKLVYQCLAEIKQEEL